MLSLNQVWGPRPIRPPWGTPRGLRPDAPRRHARPAPSSQGGPACHGDAPQLRPLLRLSPGKVRARSASWGRPRPRPNATRAGAFHRHAKQIFCIIWGTAEALAPKDKPSRVQNIRFAQKYVKPPTAGPHLGRGRGLSCFAAIRFTASNLFFFRFARLQRLRLASAAALAARPGAGARGAPACAAAATPRLELCSLRLAGARFVRLLYGLMAGSQARAVDRARVLYNIHSEIVKIRLTASPNCAIMYPVRRKFLRFAAWLQSPNADRFFCWQ